MTEKKYETVSNMIYRIRNEREFCYNTDERLDKQFINRDKLIDKIKELKDTTKNARNVLIYNELIKLVGVL